jgi:hypothetical protein
MFVQEQAAVDTGKQWAMQQYKMKCIKIKSSGDWGKSGCKSSPSI